MVLLCYLVAVNIVTFFLFGIDKYKAKHSRWRVPEATLLWLSAIGGSIGAWLGMYAWRHKTQHTKFHLGVPLILFAQIAAVALLYYLSIRYTHVLSSSFISDCFSAFGSH